MEFFSKIWLYIVLLKNKIDAQWGSFLAFLVLACLTAFYLYKINQIPTYVFNGKCQILNENTDSVSTRLIIDLSKGEKDTGGTEFRITNMRKTAKPVFESNKLQRIQNKIARFKENGIGLFAKDSIFLSAYQRISDNKNNVDSINFAAYTSLELTLPRGRDHYKKTFQEGFNRLDDNNLIFMTGRDSVVNSNDLYIGENYIYSRNNLSGFESRFASSYFNSAINVFSSFNYLEDISQSIISVKYDSNCRENSLVIRFNTPCEFSAIYPEPDIISMDGLEFNDKDKLEQIKSSGIKFHTQYKLLQNIQSIRIYFVTTFLGLFITLTFTYAGKLIRRYIKKWRQNRLKGKRMGDMQQGA